MLSLLSGAAPVTYPENPAVHLTPGSDEGNRE